jgi:hypothetical protein
MSIFQKSILNSYKQDEDLVESRYIKYRKYLSKSEDIKSWKEEEYQDGFLRDVFEYCLGYTLKTTNPQDYNLTRERKNETDGKKADGGILIDNKTVGVIELKSYSTKNLDKKISKDKLSPVDQAFGYLVSHSDARYVIVSNFDEIRLYIDKKTSYESFNLFSLDYDSFRMFHLIFSYESIKSEIPLQLKNKSQSFEVEISKQLYKDYSIFRTHLYENIIQNNTIDKIVALRCTQKLCDRIIFILFAEDRGLLNPNTIKEIREEFANQIRTNNTLYHIYKFYFNDIDKGNDRLSIPKYNGGLFATDELLDSLVIDDDILDMEAQKLSDYDFDSDVSVNILGHIFEQSLTDLEEMTATINNQKLDKTKTKRKKDGVFYTPEYITKYIVDNTLGKMCSDKREELNITEIESPKNSKRLNKKEQQTKDNLEIYKDWLFNLKILDPACGSGAFLNQALEYLIAEHKRLQNDLALMGDLFASYTVEEKVLENNLYGVDINEDAIEIAKLSLWLRTAKRGRCLTSLADKIKCGNSLLSMPFSEGDFDIVIGNPPYVRVQGLKSNYENESKIYEEKYTSAVGNYDIYVLFLEKSFKMLKKDGKLSYILPHKFLVSDFGSGIRGFLSDNQAVESLLHFGSEMVFADASTYTCIIDLSHNNKELKFKHIKPSDIFDFFEYDSISYTQLDSTKWNLTNQSISKVLNKLNTQPLKVKDVFSKIFQGLATSGDNVYLLLSTKDGLYSKSLDKIVEVEDGLLKPILKGEDISRYKSLSNKYFVIFPYTIDDGKAKPMSEEYIRDNYPKGYEYLKANEEFLRGREKGRFDNPKEWFLFSRKQGIDGVEQNKIITPDIALRSQMSIDSGKYYHGTTLYSFIKKDNTKEDYRYFLSLFNSSLMWIFIQNTSSELRGGYFRFKTKYLEQFPLPKLNNIDEQQPFIDKADTMLELNKKLYQVKQDFINELELDKIPKKLQAFELLEFDEFIKEYKKAKKLKFGDKLEEREFKNQWRALFDNDKAIVCELKSKIDTTDKEIDSMVYKLYNLTDEEVAIVESM